MKSIFRNVIKTSASAVLSAADKANSLLPCSPVSFNSDSADGAEIEETRSVSVRSVLICDHSSIGDIVCALPAISLLMKEFPEAHFSFASNFRTHALLSAIFPGCTVFNTDKGFVHALKNIRALRFDVVFVLNYSLPDRVLGVFGRSRVCVGYLSGRKCIKSRGLKPAVFRPSKEFSHLADVRLNVCRAVLGREISDAEAYDFSALSALTGDSVRPKVPCVVLCPFSKWPSKNWTQKGFVRIGQRIMELLPGCRMLVEGTAADREKAETLAGLIGSGCWSAAGDNDLIGLIRSIAKSHLLISVDSAPVHIASALGVPLLALYGPTPPELCGPWKKTQDTVIISNPESEKINYARGDWAKDENGSLMHGLDEEKVLESLENLLRRVFKI